MHRSLVNSIVLCACVLIWGLVYGNATVAAATLTFTRQQTTGRNFESNPAVGASSTPTPTPIRALNWRRHSRATASNVEPPKVAVDASSGNDNDNETQFKNVSSGSSDNVLPNALIRKIVSILGKKAAGASVSTGVATPAPAPPSALSAEPNKQLFGGRLPPFIERIIQRIQNYFSVYNPPEYFDSNRPPPTSATQQHAGITLICSNSATSANDATESVSCNEMNSSEQQEEQPEQEQGETLEMCDGGDSDGGNTAAESQDEYNVVVTHTVVQDSSLNVYAPPQAAATADSTQMVSNVVVILEPVAGQYSPPPLDNPDKNKFYVYVNPSSSNKNQHQHQHQQYQQQLKTFDDDDGGSGDERDAAAADKVENFRPYANTTYTVIIRGDKLQEYNAAAAASPSSTLAATNSSGRPEIAIYIRNSTKKLKKCKLPSSTTPPTTNAAASLSSDSNSETETEETEDCEQSASSRSVNLDAEAAEFVSNAAAASSATNAETNKSNDLRSDDKDSNKVPNINLVLVPPSDQQQKTKNKSCASKNKVNANKNPQLEYYVLKPDNGVGNKKPNKMEDKEKATATTYYLQKTNIGSSVDLPQMYLPPSPALPPVSQQQPTKDESAAKKQ